MARRLQSLARMTPGTYLDPIALGIVGGGTLLAAILRSPLADCGRALAALRALVRRKPFDGDAACAQVASFGRLARKHGVASLDRNVIADPDVASAVSALADGFSAEEVAALLSFCRRARAERHLAAADVWSGAAEAAPAMGMVGTLVGLVAMFTAMTDPKTIGSAMAVALLATLYGALLANLLAAPIANRLRRLARAESFERARIEAPLAALARLMPARTRPWAAA